MKWVKRLWWPSLFAFWIVNILRDAKFRHVDDGDPALHVTLRWGGWGFAWADVLLLVLMAAAIAYDVREIVRLRRANRDQP